MEVTTMVYQASKYTEVENISFVESVGRAVASIAIVVAVMHMPSLTALTLFGFTQLAIYAGLTAFIGWDPIYAVMKLGRTRLSVQQPAKPDAHPRPEGQAAGDDRKKAA
ncbi:MAG: hypothetical protein P8164_11755 [Gammaproteobacteria bacterium]